MIPWRQNEPSPGPLHSRHLVFSLSCSHFMFSHRVLQGTPLTGHPALVGPWGGRIKLNIDSRLKKDGAWGVPGSYPSGCLAFEINTLEEESHAAHILRDSTDFLLWSASFQFANGQSKIIGWSLQI